MSRSIRPSETGPAGTFHWNTQPVAVYQRLTGRGKTHKQALVACARELLIFANTVAAQGSAWDAKPTA
jgi:transposase